MNGATSARSDLAGSDLGPRIFVGTIAVLLATALAGLLARRPVVVLGAALAAGVVLVAAARPEFAVLLLVGTTPIESAFQISANPQVTMVKLAGLLCFSTFALNAIATRRRILLDRSHLILFLLLALALVSSIQAREVGDALVVTTRYASFVALYVVITQFPGDRHLLTRLVWVLSISSAVASLLSIRNFLGGTSLVASPTHGDPNDLAFVLATTLPLTLWLLGRGSWQRVAVLVLAGVMATGVLLSFSRGALLGLGIGVLWHTATERRHIPVLIVCALVALAGAALLVRSNPREFQLGLQAKAKVAGTNVSTRLDAWSAAVDLAVRYPILGVGPGNFPHRFLEVTDNPPGTPVLRVVHDAYLDIAAELGVTGLVLFLAFLALAFRRFTVAARRGAGPPGLAVLCRTSLVVAMAAAITLSEQYFAPFWVLGAIATVIYLETNVQPDAAAA